MAKQEVLVVVDKNGKIAIEFQGFAGERCYDEARRLQERLASLGIIATCEQVTPHASSERVPEISDAQRSSHVTEF